jgi:hypothetical protein
MTDLQNLATQWLSINGEEVIERIYDSFMLCS